MNSFPDHRTLFRLPWSLPDNPIAWLETTASCNIYCEGCYRANIKNGHKPLQVISKELETFRRYRNFDSLSIAGGEPLIHPDIVAIVRMAARMGYKPIVNTNGVALTDDLLLELKRAGAKGFTFHIDSKQSRPGWEGKNEVELNELRLDFAERLARVGGLSCAFNATVYEDTLPYVPDVVEWARRHVDKVNVVVFIAFRQASGNVGDSMDFYVGGHKVAMNRLIYSHPTGKMRLDISSRDIVATIRERFPDFSPAAFLNGTHKADSLKWLLTTQLGTRSRAFGCMGPKFMEVSQTLYHFRHGHYLAYAAPSVLRRGRSIGLLASFFDRQARKAYGRYLRHLLANPFRIFRRLHLQSVMIIQPIDVLADGGMNMCDSCPDITVHEGKLVWSCRLEELMKFGGFARAVPRRTAQIEEQVRTEAGGNGDGGAGVQEPARRD